MAPERKQIKKFLKPKVESGPDKAPTGNGRAGYALAFGAVLVVGAALWFAPFGSGSTPAIVPPTNVKSPTEKDTTAPRTVETTAATVADRRVPDPSPAKKANVVPTYDEYIIQAETNKWLPTDPILKLESSILKHTQLFDVMDANNDADKLKQYITMMSQEIQYVIAVLSAATDRTIDLTQAMTNAIDIIPEVTYRTLKWQLSVGRARQTTRAQLTNQMQHWVFGPLRELVKLMSAKHPHITMDVNAPGVGGAALVRVVKHRIYGLISVFLSVDSTPANVFEALRIAVHQGDDLAVALILNTLTAPAAKTAVPNHAQLVQEIGGRLPELLALAQKLEYSHIAGRIGGIAERLAGNLSLAPVAGVVPADKVDIFNEYFPYQRVPVTASEDAPVEIGDVDPLTGYSRFQLEPSHTTAANGFDGYINQCAVDRVDIADLTVDRFFAEYVTLNRPVLITHSKESRLQAAGANEDSASKDPVSSNKVWTLDSLLKRFGSTKDVSSAIPYATLFGHKEELVSLSGFVAGMQAYTRRLQEAVGSQGSALNEQQLLEVATIAGLPQYVFSGAHQNINIAMRKHMLKSVQNFASESSSGAADSSNRLLELMYAVSRGFNVTTDSVDEVTPRALHKDFKTHWKSQFYLGPALSGAPFHHHGPAFNLLVHGKKEWTLLPPGRDVYSSMHPVDWLREGGTGSALYPYHADKPPTVGGAEGNGGNGSNGGERVGLRTDQPCKLVQTPGEVLFVPRHWTHQILNLAETVGFAVEIDDYTA